MDFDFKEPTLLVHDLIHATKLGKSEAQEELEKLLSDKCMYDLYSFLVEKGILQPNHERIDSLLNCKNQRIQELEELRKKETENETYAEEIERKTAEFYCQVMDTQNGFEWMRKLMRDDMSLSLKMDISLCKIRMGLIVGNKRIVEESINVADDTYERGCDWDRRNRYKVYKGVFKMMERKFKEAGILFSEVLPSFESSEVISYSRAVKYMIFCGLLGFERNEIETRILKCSDVMGSSEKLGVQLATSLFECNYGSFMEDLYLFCKSLQEDVFVGRFVNLFCREMRLRVYGQVLESYRSMLLENMAETFGVSVEYVEEDLGEFIVEGRLWSKIDRISGVVEVTSREDQDASSIIGYGCDVVRRIKKCVK
ncbi:26S proteasome regulatory complex protein [Encephalitozoon intestinalis ATCC 50506]|uniref:26S proteasome regulatory complex protein n=1 Tax=Encephalitozoon intestinalis (strain ATCC 50506) TaxID=876142 RepID=E0S9F6_ENCIT|nr:26S proteasome regulatory complex protein [Encephalitozoon intestinalis ATCC 50506]ADM12341.1 26S proteasome regulatory complex protein [Encephalitozoon intestinalis ATCC 50506]UTX46171.1 proteasome regulatory subunit RPN7 [Encephalitozoon intestinalis]